MAALEGNGIISAADVAAAAARPKRVRTGCLTCRQRHLKCDEGLPHCQNCQKSNRICKRGVRLNFIDTQVKFPPVIPSTHDWQVNFQDESREIASEYKGGLSRYALLEREDVAQIEVKDDLQFDFSESIVGAPAMGHQHLPPQDTLPTASMPVFTETSQDMQGDARETHHGHSRSSTDSTYSSQTVVPPPQPSYHTSEQILTTQNESRSLLSSPEEVLFMQVFVEEVGLWMDSMDTYKHFSRLLPFDSLSEPMLLNSFLACGARHLSLVNSAYKEETALHYYELATSELLKNLQNPNRDTVTCATTAVILNVYEIMSERALQRMNHIAGARALIKECGWNANSVGIGAACFWLNVGMELLSCLHFNWQVAWDPELWGVDMDFSRESDIGREESWTFRIIYITAKVANFRSSIPRFSESTHEAEQLRLQKRYSEWKRLKDWCDSWDESVPRTMHPMAYLYAYQTASKSAFPEVWFIKRTTIVARLFFHTAMCLLAQTNPYMSPEVPEMHEMQMYHSLRTCGIVAHVKDRGVASVAIRSLAIAAEGLETRREQEEVLQIFEKIRKETGWRIMFINEELQKRWGWEDEETFQQQQMSTTLMNHPPNQAFQYQQPTILPPAPPTRMGPKPGIMNPLLRTADFSAPTHPYQNHYVAPNPHLHHTHYDNY